MGLLILLLQVTLVAIVGLFVGLFLYFWYVGHKHKNYFEARGMPYLQNDFGPLWKLMRGKGSVHEGELILYKKCLDTNSPCVGLSDMFVNPSIYITDIDMARNIYVKHFDHFTNRRSLGAAVQGDQLFQRMLFMMEGEKWKGMRSKLSPTFTTGKIRRMFDIFEKCSVKMSNYLRGRIGSSGGDFDITELHSKYAMEVIASCVFGVDSKSFESESGKKTEFEEMGQLLQFGFKIGQFFQFILVMAAPKLATMLGVEATDPRPQRYFHGVVQQVLKHRRETGERQEDFLQLMMDAQAGLLKEREDVSEGLTGENGENNQSKLKLDDVEIAANCVLFLLAGFDTIQSVLIYSAYALALEQEVQQKLVDEIKTTMEANGGKLTYDSLHEMKYLDMVINETLRYYPPVSRTERVCTKDYKIPGTDAVIEKGVLVVMSVLGLHKDPKYYENPEKFDPERFLPERKTERHPYAFSPFGHGPRNCIGMRFALTEVKVALCALVNDFKLEPCSKTDIPPQYGSAASLKPRNGLWLRIKPRAEQ